MRIPLRLILFVLAGIVLASCAPTERNSKPRSRSLPPVEPGRLSVGLGIGQIAPEIEGKDLDGVAFKLSDYRGKVVVLDFWGHW